MRTTTMSLWIAWWDAIWLLRPAFSRLRAFMWFAITVAGLTVRTDSLGVTSIVRALKLRPRLYNKLLDHFHSDAVQLDRLSALWTQAALRLFPQPLRVNGRRVLVGDGIKVAKLAKGLYDQNNHLVSRVKSNAVAFAPYVPLGPRKRGRPRLYCDRVQLKHLLSDPKTMQSATSPVYGEDNVTIQYRVSDLLWRPCGRLVRFVAVVHPSRGSCLLMCTDISLDAIEIIRLYGLRFKIEHSFKQAVHRIGAFAYHFWMRDMKPLGRRPGDQYLPRESP